MVEKAEDCGIEKIALENFSFQLVYNPETLFRLRNAVGPIVGLNLDPSHLIWMGADPIMSARELGEAIHDVHGKDVRFERQVSAINGVLEGKPEDLIVTTHLCRGNYQSTWAFEGSYSLIAPTLLTKEKVDGFFLEYDDERCSY